MPERSRERGHRRCVVAGEPAERSGSAGSRANEGGPVSTDRIAALLRMLERNPDDSRVRFGLAAEYEKAGDWENAVEALRRYLDSADDEGNAWGRLGRALRELGLEADARAAYERGVAEANGHGHPGMAAEFEEILENWD
jgi:Flp pilus assembly protein TadD